MQYRWALSLAFIASIAGASSARAQVQQAVASSPVEDLLTQAQNAYNDLNYPKADTIAQTVLDPRFRASTNQRTRALLIIAAAAYPESEGKKDREKALSALKQVVKADLDATIPQVLTWPGLDSLLADAKSTTYGIAESADAQQVIVGSNPATIHVRSNHPSTFRLIVTAVGDQKPLATDSSMQVGSTADLHFKTMQNERPSFTTGDYDIYVIGRDAQTGDTNVVREVAHVDAPALQLATPPATLDSSKLLAEHTGSFGARGLLAGPIVGAAAYALAAVLRGDSLSTAKANPIGADSKGIGVAAGLAGIIVIAGFADHGRPIPGNIAANQRTRTNFAQQVQNVATENRQRIASYQTTITMRKGAR